MTGKTMRTLPFKFTLLLLGMVISFALFGAAQAWSCTPDPGVAIPACMIKASTTGTSGPWSTSSVSIAEGQTVYFKLFKTDGTELPANDIDTIGGVNNNYAFTYKWDFNYPSSWGGDNENPTDHAFSTAGTYTVKGRLDDDNSAYPESPTDSNNTISVTVNATPSWDVDSAISGGNITAPSNNALIACSSEVNCTVSNASDQDHRHAPGENPVDTYPAETSFTYTWTAGQGSFKNGVNTGQSVTWVAPSTAVGNTAITCTISDNTTTIPQGETGTRNDTDLVRNVTVNVTNAFWEVDTAISGGSITAPANNSNYACNAEVNCTVSAASDNDHRTEPGGSPQDVADTLTYTWSATAGTFKNGVNTGQSVTWVAPSTLTSNVTITCTFSDTTQIPSGETGNRNDTDLTPSVIVHVSNAFWEVDTAISGGGILTPTSDASINPSAEVICSAADASDNDHRTPLGGSAEDRPDILTYTWTATAGSFKDGDNIGQQVTWVAPSSAQSGIQITCTVSDLAEIPSGESGNRNDTDPNTSVTVNVVPSNWTLALTITPPAVRQNNSDTAACTANLKLNGSPRSNATISFTVLGGEGEFTNDQQTQTAVTDDDGNATVQVRSQHVRTGGAADAVKAQYTFDITTYCDSKPVSFWDMSLTGPVDASWQKKGHLPANNGDEITLTASVSHLSVIEKVAFHVSQDQQNWTQVEQDCTTSPYSVQWDTDSVSSGAWYIRATATDIYGKSLSDTHSVSLLNIDLETKGLYLINGGTVHTGHEFTPKVVPDTEEDLPGAFVHYNLDDDNSDNNMDCWESDSGAEEYDPVNMKMIIEPLPTSGSVILTKSSSDVHVWKAQNKDVANALFVGTSSITWVLSDANQRNDYLALKDTLWAEGVTDGNTTFTLQLKDSNGNNVGEDSLTQNFVAATCGAQPSPYRRVYIESWLPRLVDCEWSVTGEATENYNCIAWSVNVTNERYCKIADIDNTNWVGIDQHWGNDDGVFEIEADLDPFYATKGSLTPNASGPEDAVVMYYAEFHAARKKNCSCGKGQWIMYESKLSGADERIEHVYDQLDGELYGSRIRYYK